MTGTVTAHGIARRYAGDAGVERTYRWPVATLAEGRRNLRGLASRGVPAELHRADGKVERQA